SFSCINRTDSTTSANSKVRVTHSGLSNALGRSPLTICRIIVRTRLPLLGTISPLARPDGFDCVVHARSPQPRLVSILPQASLASAATILHRPPARACELAHNLRTFVPRAQRGVVGYHSLHPCIPSAAPRAREEANFFRIEALVATLM